MNYMPKTMNHFSTGNPANTYYDQSFTYSHYYQNKKNTVSSYNSPNIDPNKNFQTQKNTQSARATNHNYNSNQQTKQNFNIKNNSKNNLNFNQTNHKNHSNQSQNNFQTSNEKKHVTENNYEEESLLLNDVYGKQESTSQNFSNKENCQNSSSTNTSNPPFDFSNLINTFFQNAHQDGTSSNQNNSQNASNNALNFSELPDMETMLKFKKIFECLKNNNNTPITNLLYAIKPFIQDSKKSMIDQIAKFITISSILQNFNGLL